MTIERKEVHYVARLARLALSDQEIDVLQDQLSRILDHAERVTSLDTEGVPPTSHAIPLSNVFRSDEVVSGLSTNDALANAPESEINHFKVPRILEEGHG